MTSNRLEAFSDGVIAILITIMVLELTIPHDHDQLADLWDAAPHLPELRPQLRLPRDLLEQPPPRALPHGAGHRRRALGQHAPALLALAGPVRHRPGWARTASPRRRRRSTASCCSWRRSPTSSSCARSSTARARTPCWRGPSATTSRARLSVVLYAVAIPLALVVPWASLAHLHAGRGHVAGPRPAHREGRARLRERASARSCQVDDREAAVDAACDGARRERADRFTPG